MPRPSSMVESCVPAAAVARIARPLAIIPVNFEGNMRSAAPETMRACDHQAVQSVLILQSKAKAAMKNAADLFDVLATDEGSEANLRSCADLGHMAGK